MSIPRVRAIVMDSNDRVLLGYDSYHENYNLPGGKADPGEHPVDALVRELKEEAGLNAAEIVYLGDYLNNHTFLVTPSDPQNLSSPTDDPDEEFTQLEWFHISALPDNLYELAADILFGYLRGRQSEHEVVAVNINGERYTWDLLNKKFSKKGKLLGDEISIEAFTSIHAGKIEVYIDDRKVYEFADDKVWETMPRLAQERAKGKKIKFKHILDDGTVVNYGEGNPQIYFYDEETGIV